MARLFSALDATVQRVKEGKAIGMGVGLDFHGILHKHNGSTTG